MIIFFLFITGLFIGSFLNVLILRYEPGKRLFGFKVIGGRSHCRSCKNTLQWYELIPLLSFVIQRGRCRYCEQSLSWQYPTIELITGLLTAFIPLVISSYLAAVLWLLVSYALIINAAIDFRHQILPDQINFFVALVGLLANIFTDSFLGSAAAILTIQNIFLNFGAALLFSLIIFGGLVLITRGRGMGLGDVKLALALAILFGWPDIVLLSALSFILGGAFSLGLIFAKIKKFKDSVPFGPFLVVSAFAVIFYGQNLVSWYIGFV